MPAGPETPPDPAPPRLGWGLLALGLAALLACAGPGAWVAAGQVERLAETRAEEALRDIAADWAGAEADGLRLRLTGAFPDETSHNAALAALARSAPMTTLFDDSRPAAGDITLAAAVEGAAPASRPAAPPPPDPDEPLTLSRDGAAVVAAGPAHPDVVQAVREALAAIPGAPELRDATFPRDQPPTANRLVLARAAAAAIAVLREAQVEIGPGVLSLAALAPGAAEAAEAERRLREAAPPGSMLLVDIDTPPPALSPFRFIVALGDTGPALLGCDMRSDAERRAVLKALSALPEAQFAPRGDALCRLGVGAPSLRVGRRGRGGDRGAGRAWRRPFRADRRRGAPGGCARHLRPPL